MPNCSRSHWLNARFHAASAAAVNQVGAGHAAGVQQLVQIMLHQKVKKERTAAQADQGPRRADGVDEFLYARKVRRIQHKHRHIVKTCRRVRQRLLLFAVVRGGAGGNGCRDFCLIVQRNIRVFGVRGIRREAAEPHFQQVQQGIRARRALRQILQQVCQRLQCLGVVCGGNGLRGHGQLHPTVLRAGRHIPAGMLPVQVGKNRSQRAGGVAVGILRLPAARRNIPCPRQNSFRHGERGDANLRRIGAGTGSGIRHTVQQTGQCRL